MNENSNPQRSRVQSPGDLAEKFRRRGPVRMRRISPADHRNLEGRAKDLGIAEDETVNVINLGVDPEKYFALREVATPQEALEVLESRLPVSAYTELRRVAPHDEAKTILTTESSTVVERYIVLRGALEVPEEALRIARERVAPEEYLALLEVATPAQALEALLKHNEGCADGYADDYKLALLLGARHEDIVNARWGAWWLCHDLAEEVLSPETLEAWSKKWLEREWAGGRVLQLPPDAHDRDAVLSWMAGFAPEAA